MSASIIDNYCAFYLLKTEVKKLFLSRVIKNVPSIGLGSIYEDVIRKMMAPGKIFLYVLKVSLMVHINTKFHDSI